MDKRKGREKRENPRKQSKVWAIVGLGNPGRDYARTRHNAGFLLVRLLARQWEIRLKKHRFKAKIGEGFKGEQAVILMLPQTWMNNSGLAVKELVQHRDLTLNQLLVVYDDLDIVLGEIRVRPEGSSGGHRGVESIIKEIGDTRFPRVRLGIGPLPVGADAAEYVLAPFTEDEFKIMKESLAKAAQAVELILEGKIDEAMSRFNQKIKLQ